MKQLHDVFVYGTLMSGFGNNSIISHTEPEIDCSIGPIKATTEDDFMLTAYTHSFPAMYRFVGADAAPVHGEIWSVHPMTLERMDTLEGHPHWYKREKIWGKAETGVRVQVMTYIMQGRLRGQQIPNHDCKKFKENPINRLTYR